MKKFSMILLVFILGCKSAKTISESEPVIYMNKTACFGTCPDYDISIFSDGSVLLNARQFVEMEGTFEARLPKEELKALVNAFKESQFDDFKNEYKSNKTDLPTTTIAFNHEEVNKKIIDYDGAPEELKELESKVHSLVKKLNWKKKG